MDQLSPKNLEVIGVVRCFDVCCARLFGAVTLTVNHSRWTNQQFLPRKHPQLCNQSSDVFFFFSPFLIVILHWSVNFLKPNIMATNNIDARVYYDFDQVSAHSPTCIEELVISITEKLVRSGRVAAAARIHHIAIGNHSAFRNEVTLRSLTLLQVQVRVVSAKKQEETDRHIERDAEEHSAPVIVLVSSDQDFIHLAKKFVQRGQHFVFVHEAEKGSSHETRLRLYASEVWRLDEHEGLA